MKRLVFTLALAFFVGAPAFAAPGPQLLAQIEYGLARYNIKADVSRLTTAQAAELHLILVAPEGYIRTRQKLKTALRRTSEAGE